MNKELEALEKISNVEIPNGTNQFDVRKMKDFKYLNEQIEIIEQALKQKEQQAKELSELKSKVGNFIDKHMAYPYGENGELFDDEYTKGYVELKEMVGESDE